MLLSKRNRLGPLSTNIVMKRLPKFGKVSWKAVAFHPNIVFCVHTTLWGNCLRVIFKWLIRWIQGLPFWCFSDLISCHSLPSESKTGYGWISAMKSLAKWLHRDKEWTLAHVRICECFSRSCTHVFLSEVWRFSWTFTPDMPGTIIFLLSVIWIGEKLYC